MAGDFYKGAAFEITVLLFYYKMFYFELVVWGSEKRGKPKLSDWIKFPLRLRGPYLQGTWAGLGRASSLCIYEAPCSVVTCEGKSEAGQRSF